MPFLNQIDRFYTEVGLGQAACCSHCDAEAIGYNLSRFGPKATFVGSKYGQDGLPRLVFLSLDPGKVYGQDELAPKTVQESIERYVPSNPHSYGMHLLALRILNEFNMLLELRHELFQVTGRYLATGAALTEKLLAVTPYFAHVNSAKCCTNDPAQENGMKKAPGGFFVNCRDFARKELEILRPHIIVTQGVEARAVISDESRSGGSVIRSQIAGNQALWISTSHPANGCFWTEGCPPLLPAGCDGRDWCNYAGAAKEFWQEICRAPRT